MNRFNKLNNSYIGNYLPITFKLKLLGQLINLLANTMIKYNINDYDIWFDNIIKHNNCIHSIELQSYIEKLNTTRKQWNNMLEQCDQQYNNKNNNIKQLTQNDNISQYNVTDIDTKQKYTLYDIVSNHNKQYTLFILPRHTS